MIDTVFVAFLEFVREVIIHYMSFARISTIIKKLNYHRTKPNQ